MSLQLLGWDQPGNLILNQQMSKSTTVLSGCGESDITIAELAGSSLFASVSVEGINWLHQTADGVQTTKQAMLGETVSFCGLTWCAISLDSAASEEPEAEVILDQAAAPFAKFLTEINQWAARPMGGKSNLNECLNDFLDLVTKQSGAENSMLVLSETSGFRLVSARGLTKLESQRLWEKMPQSLPEEILKSEAKILLPEQLRRTTNGDTTVFIDGVKSVAGFPVFAEGRLVAIFYLGFRNLLTELSFELQCVLESVSDLLGLIIQRAEYREQVASLELAASARNTESTLPEGRLMVGFSQPLAEVYSLIQKFAPVDVPVLIQGETGTGKELAAKELHRLSLRSKQPFVVLNAAALPESLIESELFGHKRGAFTGALSDRVGLVEQADGGTLFIDEIGELPLSLQAKFLRVLQEHKVTRIGETNQRQVSFRLLCATHRNLMEMTESGTFRDDLYYRIAGTTIPMPSLHQRRPDIMVLANFFKNNFANLHSLKPKEWSLDAVAVLENYNWPGNIRELENTVSRASIMAEGSMIKASDLGLIHEKDQQIDQVATPKLNQARDEWMKSFLAEALEKHSGKRAETAKALGIGERTLFRYIDQLGIRS